MRKMIVATFSILTFPQVSSAKLFENVVAKCDFAKAEAGFVFALDKDNSGIVLGWGEGGSLEPQLGNQWGHLSLEKGLCGQPEIIGENPDTTSVTECEALILNNFSREKIEKHPAKCQFYKGMLPDLYYRN